MRVRMCKSFANRKSAVFSIGCEVSKMLRGSTVTAPMRAPAASSSVSEGTPRAGRHRDSQPTAIDSARRRGHTVHGPRLGSIPAWNIAVPLKVVILGANGFIGSALTAAILRSRPLLAPKATALPLRHVARQASAK
jgi:hypothetical protein